MNTPPAWQTTLQKLATSPLLVALISATVSPALAVGIEWLLTGQISQIMVITAALVGFMVAYAMTHVVLFYQNIIQQQAHQLQKLAHELQESNQQLLKNNQDLDAFAHTVAHDLKTPLASIIGYGEMITEYQDKLPQAKVMEQVRIMTRGGYQMKNIIEALLLLASLRQMETIPLAPLAMGQILQEVEERLGFMMEQYQAQLSYPAEWPPAVGYAPWVAEIWANYVSNAIKYGGQPPIIECGATPYPTYVKFWVKDNGRGLTPAEQTQLFAQFTRLEQTQTEGHGLGLSIVKRIVEKCGGEIGVESEGIPGRGSLFFFTLPTNI
jgi:signal transduction histidine kinase